MIWINVLEYLENETLPKCRDKTFVVDNDRSFTYGEIVFRSRKWAAAIIEKMGSIKNPVAVYLPKCAETIVADIAILYSANFYTNLDITTPMKRNMALVGNIKPSLIITNKNLMTDLTTSGVKEDQIVLIEDLDQYNADGKPFTRIKELIDTDPMCIINTSGSTGIPKSVLIAHRGIIDFLEWANDNFSHDENTIIGNLSPLYFDIYMYELVLCFKKGCALVIIPENLKMFPINLLKYMERKKISFIFWVPTIMVNIANVNILDKVDLSCVKLVWYAGEVLPTRHLNIWRKHLPQAMFVNLYGPIEISVDCTYYIIDRDFGDDEPVPIGYPCRNSDVFILNGDNKLAEPGEKGELCVRGSSLALGYYNNREKTAQVFTQNPLNPNYPELIYRTGDLVYRNEKNQIMFIGRMDYLIKHLGYRIELSEIEYAVVSLSFIKNACVLYNAGEKQITLFYESEGKVEPARIIKELQTVLPKYMIPTAFHQLDEIPMNPNGKIDRNLLKEKYLDQGDSDALQN